MSMTIIDDWHKIQVSSTISIFRFYQEPDVFFMYYLYALKLQNTMQNRLVKYNNNHNLGYRSRIKNKTTAETSDKTNMFFEHRKPVNKFFAAYF